MKPTHLSRENWRTDNATSSTPLSSTQLTNRILGVLIAVAIGMAVVMGILEEMSVGEFFSSLSTEIFGAAVTFYALELVVRPKKQREDEATRKQHLIRDMSSRVNSIAVKAAEELRRENWLQDGSLHGANLSYAVLHDAYMRNADLQEVDLAKAHLQRAKLNKADLARAILERANLESARLNDADLTEVDMEAANLQKAYFRNAILHGANFQYASLRDTEGLENASFDEHTILPNGDHWHKDYDVNRFTDPSHPQFWEMDWQTMPKNHRPNWLIKQQDSNVDSE